MEMLSVRPVCPVRLREAPGALRTGSERTFRLEVCSQIAIGTDLTAQKGRANVWRWIIWDVGRREPRGKQNNI